MKSLIFLLFLSVLQSANAVGIYKWIDEDGRKTYGNNPPEDIVKDKVTLPEITIIESREQFQDTRQDKFETKINTSDTSDTEVAKEDEGIEAKFEVASPKDDEVLRANDGNVSVKFILQPALKENESIVIYLDGKQLLVNSGLEANLEALDRGTHSLFAVRRDVSGNVVANSNNVKFHILRNSVRSR